jgi:hypothetical protein
MSMKEVSFAKNKPIPIVPITQPITQSACSGWFLYGQTATT